MNIVIKDDKNRIKGKLEGVFEKGKHISANYYSKSGERYPIFLQAKEHLKTGRKEYADYVACFDISFPKTKSTSFNRWMDNEADQWMNKCRQQNYEIKKANNNTKKPETRSSIRANGWSDVDYFDEKIISGFLTFENTWTDELNTKSFNFDFRSGTEITLHDIFEDDFDHEGLVQEFLNNDIYQHKLYSDYAFRKWLSGQRFSYFLIHQDGIAFLTDFSHPYGRQKVKITYEDLKPYMKENNILDYLMNSNEDWFDLETKNDSHQD